MRKSLALAIMAGAIIGAGTHMMGISVHDINLKQDEHEQQVYQHRYDSCMAHELNRYGHQLMEKLDREYFFEDEIKPGRDWAEMVCAGHLDERGN